MKEQEIEKLAHDLDTYHQLVKGKYSMKNLAYEIIETMGYHKSPPAPEGVREILEDAKSILADQLGDWISVTITYIPIHLQPIAQLYDRIQEAVELLPVLSQAEREKERQKGYQEGYDKGFVADLERSFIQPLYDKLEEENKRLNDERTELQVKLTWLQFDNSQLKQELERVRKETAQ
ncbi:hypothetical protein M0R04_08475 [Candidatus Dojkabacteria bacterium]|jgi:hypothetical protein|nr:hypothetical protein [Candidatus Dojkabacteria bacterium]